MYQRPSRRKRKAPLQRLNLNSIMDAIFIFIFFLLFTANFNKLYEIISDVPIVSSNNPPPQEKEKRPDKPPLSLTLKIEADAIYVLTGTPGKVNYTIEKLEDGYNWNKLHELALQLKEENLSEDTVILEPAPTILYEEIVRVMDELQLYHEKEAKLVKKDSEGLETKLKKIWEKIIFGNLLS